MPDTQTSSQPEQIDLGAEAVRLAELGYAVFPCCDPRNDDSPDGKKGKNR